MPSDRETVDDSQADRSASGAARGRGAVPPNGRVGRYQLDGVLGQGAMATVYAARDLTLHRKVALKLIHAGDDDAAIRRLVREAQAIAKISHPNVIHVYDAGWEADGLVYIAMEQIAGTTLDLWAQRQTSAQARGSAPRTPVQLAALCETFAAAGRGLAAAHDAGLIHRDFKPQNVLVGEDGRVRVLDFGLACAADPDHEIDSGGRLGGLLVGVAARATAAGALVGTPAYMSPEQWRGHRADARSDQFAFCVSLFEAVAGRHPFDVSSRAALREAVLAGVAAPLPPSVPRGLRRLLERGLALEPAARFPSMHALVAQLAELGGRPRRWRVAAMALPVVAAATAALIYGAVTRGGQERQQERRDAAPTLYQAPERLTARGDLARAAVSPDERQLAYLTGDALLVQALRRDAEPRVLLRGRLGYEVLSWSPDGRELAVMAAPDSEPAGAALALWIVDVASGAARRLGPKPSGLPSSELGSVALLGGAELVAAQFVEKELSFYATSAPTSDDASAPLRLVRRCPLPGAATGIRSLGYLAARDAVLVQLDRGDRESAFLEVDRGCARFTEVASALQALSYVVRSGDGRLLVRLMYRHDLVEVGADGRPTTALHVVQSHDYTPLAVLADRRVVHQNASARWQLLRAEAGGLRELAAGNDDSRFAFSPDGATVAHVSGVYRDGVLRVGALASLQTRAVQLADQVARVAWSPDGKRLAVLFQSERGYDLATWELASGAFSPRLPLPLAYDGGMTWLDERRVAFGTPPLWRGFHWVDPQSGERGQLSPAEAGKATRALTRAGESGQLAYFTEEGERVVLWKLAGPDATTPVQLATVTMQASRAARQLRLVWSHDERQLLLYDGPTGELWTIDATTGQATAAPPFPLPRGGGFTRVNEIFPLDDQLIIETVTNSADVYVSAPQATATREAN